MELAVAVAFGIAFLLACGVVGYRMAHVRLREAVVAAVRQETERLEQKVDGAARASSKANVLAQHAIASAERAEGYAAASAEDANKAALRSLLARHAAAYAGAGRVVTATPDPSTGVIVVASESESKVRGSAGDPDVFFPTVKKT